MRSYFFRVGLGASMVSNDTVATFSASVLLGNDTDPNGDQLQIISVSGANVTYNSATQTITYNTDPLSNNTVNAGSFTYVVSDGHGNTTTGTVSIDTVNGDNVNLLSSYTTAGSYQASYIDSGNGTDVDTGGPSPDALIGGNGKDTLSGGDGSDILRGGQDDDTIDGQGATGNVDLIDFSDGTAGLTFALIQSTSNTVFNASAAGLGSDTYRNIEGVIGTNFIDTLNGSALGDTLIGGGGNDTINGLDGADTLIGGLGADLLTGGLGPDIYKWISELETGTTVATRDTVSGFSGLLSGAGGDILDLSLLDADTSVIGDQAFVFTGTTATANSVWATASGADTIVSGDINGDLSADFMFVLTGLTPANLASGDFKL